MLILPISHCIIHPACTTRNSTGNTINISHYTRGMQHGDAVSPLSAIILDHDLRPVMNHSGRFPTADRSFPLFLHLFSLFARVPLAPICPDVAKIRAESSPVFVSHGSPRVPVTQSTLFPRCSRRTEFTREIARVDRTERTFSYGSRPISGEYSARGRDATRRDASRNREKPAVAHGTGNQRRVREENVGRAWKTIAGKF